MQLADFTAINHQLGWHSRPLGHLLSAIALSDCPRELWGGRGLRTCSLTTPLPGKTTVLNDNDLGAIGVRRKASDSG